MPSIDEVFGVPPKFKGLDLYGLELEIEDQGYVLENGLKVKGWKSVPDGSLRNNGTEYITAPPLPLKEVQGAIERLFSVINTTSEECYSDRTSIHVHCNMQGLDVDNLKSMCLLYLVTEQLFFDFVAKERFENVFCVPLMDFTAPFSLFEALKEGRVSRVWTKYSALNLLPLNELGTVEFRHMHGTNDVNKIVTWVAAIDCLKQACKAKSFEDWRKQISGLNTSSEYGTFLMEVFANVEKDFLNNKTFDYYKEALYTNVMRAKLWELHEKTPTVKKSSVGDNVAVGGERFNPFDAPNSMFYRPATRPRPARDDVVARWRETGIWAYTYTEMNDNEEVVSSLREATPQVAAILTAWLNSGTYEVFGAAHFGAAREVIDRLGFEPALLDAGMTLAAREQHREMLARQQRAAQRTQSRRARGL